MFGIWHLCGNDRRSFAGRCRGASKEPKLNFIAGTMTINSYLVKSTVVAALGGLLFGFDTAVIAGTTRALTETYGLTPAMLGITVSGALWGTVIGSICAGPPSDRYGRRACLSGLGALYAPSAIGCAPA